jgi:hypothetical protein
MKDNRVKQLVEEIGDIAIDIRREYYGPIPIPILERMVDRIDERLSELCQIISEMEGKPKQ